MLRSIHEVGRATGKKTMGEWVESPAVLERLREVGVDQVQGFAIARPQLLEALVATGLSR